MPRALSVQRSVVPPESRAAFLVRARSREAHFAEAGCHFWLFEEESRAGAFMEFAEASDAAVLRRANITLSEPLGDATRIFHQVDLGL